MVHPSHRAGFRQGVIMLLIMAFGLLLAGWVPNPGGIPAVGSYVAVHTVLEMAAVVIAVMVFTAGWNGHRRQLPGNIVMLACAFLGVGVLDLSHAMSYQGMPDYVTPAGPEKAINFWLLARLLAAVALLTVAITPWRRLTHGSARYLWLGGVLTLVGLAHWVILVRPDLVPRTFIAGSGLTPLKVGFEYLIVAVNVATVIAMVVLMRRPRSFNAAAFFSAAGAMALSECFFTLYARVDDIYNFLGHLYKVVSYAFLYRAVFVEVIEEPYRQLAATKGQLRATLDAIPDLLFEMDSSGRYLSVHTHRPDQLLRPAEHILNKTVKDVLPAAAAESVLAALAKARIQGLAAGAQLNLPFPDGPRWFELSISRKGPDCGDETRFIVLSRDITERKQTEEALRAREAAVQASKAKSEFLSRMSHELRTPLNAVIGFAQLLLINRGGSLAPPQVAHVEHILRAGRHLLEMINEILDLTRIESGHAAFDMAAVRIDELLADTLPLVAPQAQARSITVDSSRIRAGACTVWGDTRRLRQVLLNVLSNAVKYNRPGGRITLRCEQRPHGPVALVIADTGKGLTAAQLGALFEPFNRLGAEKEGIEGTGLGLYITRRLLESMGGSVHVESEPGVGTAVTLLLPCEPAPQAQVLASVAPVAAASAPPAPKAASGEKSAITVLCIEDNPLNIALIEAIFDLRPGVRLLVAHTGAEGLAMAQDNHPDLVLVDINLPDMDGAEVLQALRQSPRGSEPVCIALSADVSGDPVARARSRGFADFWPKPLDVDSFLVRLDAVLGHKAGWRPKEPAASVG